ncbi:MAG: NADP-dependent oxidoreductase [Burkholderiaceae bacterium]|nr:NADP-dependent oxidoreductase [Burkholderiaceae bacterium]
MNLQVRMRRFPQGRVDPADFELVESPVPEPGDGEVLVRNAWLSLDPYMRLRMDPRRSYVEGLRPGDLMPGGAVGVVVASRDATIPRGARVVGTRMGWQLWSCVPGAALRAIPDNGVPWSTALGVCGMPGIAAHYGLFVVGRVRRSETVVVSAASGAVGSVVGQLARICGARAIGIAGGAAKCRYVVEELGFDDCIDYRGRDFEARLADATPRRVDVQFENVGGKVMDAVLGRLNDHARVVLCGLVSEYEQGPVSGLLNTRELLVNRATLQAFIVSEHSDYWPGALDELAQWVRNGELRYREDVSEGLEKAPTAFASMLHGGNFGKKLVRLRDDPVIEQAVQ